MAAADILIVVAAVMNVARRVRARKQTLGGRQAADMDVLRVFLHA